MSPYYPSELIFNHFLLWPSGPSCLRDFAPSGMLFSWKLHGWLPHFLDLCSNVTFISYSPPTTPQVLSIPLPCIFPHGTDHHLTDYIFNFLASGHLILCVVTRTVHRCHSRYWGTMWIKVSHKYFATPPIER